MATTYETIEEWEEVIGTTLQGINGVWLVGVNNMVFLGYNPSNIDLLEKFVEFQAENKEYNFEANLTLVKLYLFNPTKYRHDIVVKVLLCSLMALPRTHFSLLLDILPLNQQSNEDIKKISKLCTLLESCCFNDFWSTVEETAYLTNSVNGFIPAVKNYIIHLINITYQSVRAEFLQVYLGGINDAELAQIASLNKWKVDRGVVNIREQESYIKPKRILAKIDFDSVSSLIQSAR